jgi:hypothetical protein
MSSLSNTVFANLVASFPTWTDLSSHLRSAEGGNLTVYTVPNTSLAMIHYNHQRSDFSVPHVGAFRSVVWNTVTNRPVSVTPFKSEAGEVFEFRSDPFPVLVPGAAFNLVGAGTIRVESFEDGVLIGQFWDADTQSWRIHTRSTLDATANFFSKRSFAELWADVKDKPAESDLDKSVCYSWILAHPENRVGCVVAAPSVRLVGQVRVAAESGVVAAVNREETVPALKKFLPGHLNTFRIEQDNLNHVMNAVLIMLKALNAATDNQGLVFISETDPFRRWKVRTATYNKIRHMRGNSPRLDFHWMDLWSKGQLAEYLKFFPEERAAATALVNRWKDVTSMVYRVYADVFKSRVVPKEIIPARFRPLIYALHGHYISVLRPVNRSLDWNTTVRFLNERDTAQKIYVLNWDINQGGRRSGVGNGNGAAATTIAPATIDV